MNLPPYAALIGAVADPDGDGVIRELSVGDVTAMTIYTAGQEVPQPLERLAELGMVAPPDAETIAVIGRGRHVREMQRSLAMESAGSGRDRTLRAPVIANRSSVGAREVGGPVRFPGASVVGEGLLPPGVVGVELGPGVPHRDRASAVLVLAEELTPIALEAADDR